MSATDARAEILARVRANLAGAQAPPLREPRTGDAPRTEPADLLRTFRGALESVGARLHHVRTEVEAGEIVRSLLAETGGSVFSSATARVESLLDGIPARIVRPGDDRALLLEAEVGVTEAQLGIAETGTLVLASQTEAHRLASLLPRVHVALLDASLLVADLGEALRRLHTAGPPPVATFVTGPSRTGDIELKLVVGVHGPEVLEVVLLGDPA